MNSLCVLSYLLLVTITIQTSRALPLMDLLLPESEPDAGPAKVEQTTAAAVATAVTTAPVSGDADLPYIRYETVVPVMKIVLTPIGRMVQPMIEQWLADRFGPYIETFGRAVESISSYATDNISFQTGDTYYTKSDLIDGYGYKSLILNLPSGKSVTVLTHKSRQKYNILDDFPQLTTQLNEVRNLQ